MSLIFIVDDSTLSRNSLSRLIEAEGHKAICLAESVDAADMIEEARPDLLLLDVVMPKLSGIELLKILRSALRTREYMERLVYLAERDGLTGLYNHATFLRELERALSGLSAPGSYISVVMCDIDFFKHINDEHGHQAGDAVLAGLGSLISSSLGTTGTAGRYGGEEFCIMLGGFDRAMAARWAEALRAHIEERTWDACGISIRFTMSFGVASVEGGIAEEGKRVGAREVLAEADQRLYAAKRSGRNRVVSTDAA
jgi:two-component system, cell cycle response regulator